LTGGGGETLCHAVGASTDYRAREEEGFGLFLLLSGWPGHDTSILHHYFYIIIYCYSLIYFIFRDDTYIISPVFACLMIIRELAARVRILLEKGLSRHHISEDQQF
jgi:hypothetical protein